AAGVSPPSVDRAGPRPAAAAKAGHVGVRDAGGGEARRKRLAPEVGVSARAWDGPTVHELRRVVRAQQAAQPFDRPRAVADGPDHASEPVTQSAENRWALPMFAHAQACTFARICRRWLRS